MKLSEQLVLNAEWWLNWPVNQSIDDIQAERHICKIYGAISDKRIGIGIEAECYLNLLEAEYQKDIEYMIENDNGCPND